MSILTPDAPDDCGVQMSGGAIGATALTAYTRPLCVLGEWQVLKQDYLRPVKSASFFRSVRTQPKINT